ncbi:L-glutamate gamma-semialdehyde dehydrogenase [Hydrogenophaga sp. 5NK40-0174]|uniref:L-glutamate gamma-semialdehyde dehydrogenase n=1 Tax=Hydrogenophaga sp. 5NK40-0174 TaxID=3127649 RepID=UPI003340FE54
MTDRLPSPYRPEASIVQACLDQVSPAIDWAKVQAHSGQWVTAVREHPPSFWAMERLLQEYPISRAEGRALMRLAEALLRVPDGETALALTADQLGSAPFDPADHSPLGRLSASVVSYSRQWLEGGSLVKRLGGRTVVAATVRTVQLLGRQFVLGESIGAALGEAASARKKQPHLHFSFDMLGEGARTDADALRYLQSYAQAIEAIAAQSDPTRHPGLQDGISIKLSALHPRYEHGHHERVMEELLPRLWPLCEAAATAGLNLTIDAEEVDRLELSLVLFDALLSKVAEQFPQWQGLGLALQAYQTRSLELIQLVIAMARRHQVRLMCRLVKGAYWDAEIKRAQELGLPHYPVFTHKHHTDISYLACARAMIAATDVIYPQFATHNAGTIAALLQLTASLTQLGHTADAPLFELQRLHGMGEGVYREVLGADDLHCRIYAPVGAHRDLLAYLVRRLLENGANSSFVHQLADPDVPVNEVLASPLHVTPTAALPAVAALYGPGFPNSQGLDVAESDTRRLLMAAWGSALLPVVTEATPDEVVSAVDRARQAFVSWDARSVEDRAAILRAAAGGLQASLPRFSALIVKEAHRNWSDAISEVREAIDFLRYYAAQAQTLMAVQTLPAGGDGVTGERNQLRTKGRGAWVCISPWNFPLAIFTGQIAAALVTGNTVLAKPAEQTPGVAKAMVQLLHEAGVPGDVLQLLHGAGETVGAQLVGSEGIAGVVFTGSTPVAKRINLSLAQRHGPILPLIAETGGINAMVVDSTALPEQVCDAVVQSAFRSAGQRCSALRLLCVHESVADAVITMITGAAKELKLGAAEHWDTDVTRLIDQEAFDRVQSQLTDLRGRAVKHWTETATSPVACEVPPQVVEVSSVSSVKEEIFGPVLQVVRWSGDPLSLIDQINALGYGLTLGIQTRIDSRAAAMAAAARIGNVYVNRNMIGAVVGNQPFGGEGMSGTGPKAGGPHYLLRFCAEQTVTVNTAAAGGNVDLMTRSAVQPSARIAVCRRLDLAPWEAGQEWWYEPTSVRAHAGECNGVAGPAR